MLALLLGTAAIAGSDFRISDPKRVAVFAIATKIDLGDHEIDLETKPPPEVYEQRQAQAAQTYHLTVNTLRSAYGWEVLGLDAVRGSEAYDPFWTAATPAANRAHTELATHFVPPRLLHADLALTVKQEPRDALMEALGVDHLVMAHFSLSALQPGPKRARPIGFARLVVYAKGEKKAVWKGNARGQAGKAPVRIQTLQYTDAEFDSIKTAMRTGLRKLRAKVPQ